jgi:hypothetical protein
MIDDWGHPGTYYLIDLQDNMQCPWPDTTSPLHILPLPEQRALLLAGHPHPLRQFSKATTATLYSPDAKFPLKKQGSLGLSAASFVSREKCLTTPGGNDWLVEIVAITAEDGLPGSSLEIQTLRLDLAQQRLSPDCSGGTSKPIRTKHNISSWTRLGEHLAVGYYQSGRIELRRISSLSEVVAVGYTSGDPTQLCVVRRREGVFLVAVAGELVWFDVSRYAVAQNPSP